MFSRAKFDERILGNKVTCFKADKYPFLFISMLFKSLKKNNKVDIKFIRMEDTDLSNLKLNLEQFFLGANKIIFWIGDISNYKKKNELISYLSDYAGPYNICFFINSEEVNSSKIEIISCENITKIEQLESILYLWDINKHKIILQFIKYILNKYNKLTLDEVCMFADYAILLGNRYSNFINEWLDNILTNDYSLFTLSKYFFSYEAKLFFKYWNSISEKFDPIFWTTFWSEQLYRAINFLILRNEKKNLQAKQITYKLPFTFIQNDWKKHSISDLQKSHQIIYNIDYSLKNGQSDISLDLFFAKFFAKELR